ncbi:MAG: ABC transporter substrate-binding protein [Peptostreptococcaceae bacterium]|nr:ABC transporter substrate-binding protein [Peptostreptococcaceae bacterium]
MKKIAALIMTFVLLFTTACSSHQTSTDNKKQVADRKTDEAVLYLGDLSEPSMGFDPILGWANVDGVSIFHSNLLKQDKDMNIVGDLAESYEISKDGKAYTFKLRDAKFSDGTKITSKDVAFTYKKAAEAGYVGNLDQITTIDTPDDQTVVIHLGAPNILFVYAVIRLGIVPENSYNESYGKNPVSSGAYKLVQWDEGQQLIVEENPEYFGEKPKLKKLTVLFLSEEAAFEAAKKGTLDLYSVSGVYASQEVEGMDPVEYQSVDVKNIGWSVEPSGKVMREDGLAVGNDVTSDVAIRKAINIGIDRQTIVDGILGGHGSPAYDLVDPSMPWYNPETAYDDNDAEGAKKILSDAGWIDTDGDGVVEKNGLKAEFTVVASSDSKINQGLAMAVSEMAKVFGVQIHVESKSWEEIDTMLYAQPYVLTWGSKDPINIQYLFDSVNMGKGYYNSGYYKNDKVDEYISSALQANTEEASYVYWKKAQWDGDTGFSTKADAPWLWLARLNHVYRIKRGLNVGEQGLQNASMGWALLHNITEWSWDE